MKKIVVPVLIILTLVFLCGCGGGQRVRFILKPESGIGSEALENSAKAYQEVIFPNMLPEFSKFECVRVGENIQVDCRGKIKNENELEAFLAEKFRCEWLEAFTQDETPVFTSRNIEKAEFEENEEGRTMLVIKLDAQGTSLFERATVEHNKEKLIIYLDGITFGEYRMDNWIKNGKCAFSPDALMDSREKKQEAIDRIMSGAGLECRFSVLYSSVL